MKAVLLAAGEGTRLRPYTDNRPKPMMELGGKPILGHNLALLHRHGVRDVIINLHHRADAITAFCGDGSQWGLHIDYSYEEELRGTAGAVKKVASMLSDPFFVLYADNLTGCDLTGLAAFHRRQGGIATIAVYESLDPTGSGIVELAADGRVLRFREKPGPGETFSNLANAGVYVLEPRVLEAIPEGAFTDFGRHVFPQLLSRGEAIFGWRTPPIVKVDTARMYEQTQAALTAGELLLPGQ